MKIKRSKIFFILFAATVILWIPSILNADMNFSMQAEGISPENNFSFKVYGNGVVYVPCKYGGGLLFF